MRSPGRSAGLFCLGALMLCAMQTAAQDQWTVRCPTLAVYAFLNAVVRAGSGVVAVGDGGAVVTSPDGITWTQQRSGTARNLHAVAWTGTQLVAVGDSGTVLTSPDGVAWASQLSGCRTRFNGLTWADSQLVAVGDSATIVTSADGVVWTRQQTPPSGSYAELNCIVWTGSLFVTAGWCGSGVYVLISPDGSEWTQRDSGASGAVNCIVWTGTQLVATGGEGFRLATVRTSPDGVFWTVQDSGAGAKGMAWTGRQLVAVGRGDSVWTSPDGVVWTGQWTGTGRGGDDLRGVCWDGGEFIAVGFNYGAWANVILASADGVAWSQRAQSFSWSLTSVAATGSRLVATGYNGLLNSTDGIVWWTSSDGPGGYRYSDVASSGSNLAVVGWHFGLMSGDQSPVISTSSEGIACIQASGYPMQMPSGCTWMDSQLVVVGAHGTIYAASCSTGMDRSLPWASQRSLSRVIWTGRQLVVVGDSGTIVTSLDGAAWTQQASGTQRALFALAWGDSQLVALGDSGTVLTSPSGVTWTLRSSGTSDALRAAAWTGSRFVAVGDSGTVLVSFDGITWLPRTSGTTANLRGITCSGNQLVAVGGTQGATVLTAPLVTAVVGRPHQSGLELPPVGLSAVCASRQSLTAQLTLPHSTAVTLRLRNLRGQTVCESQFKAEETGSRSVRLPLPGIAAGSYLLEASAGGANARRFVFVP